MPKLRFDKVSHEYLSPDGKNERTHALSRLDFSLQPGESVALIGPSGCGKSSALKMAAGLLQPSSGQVLVDDKVVEEPRQQTSLILQNFGLLPWKTVRKNVELGLKIRGIAARQRRERAMKALEMVGLSDFADSYPGGLSGGMQQRLALARSLALDVDLLLMDEPLSALDALMREQLQDTLLQLWQSQGYAQVLVTHSIEEAVYLGQRVIVLAPRPGRVVGEVANPHVGHEGYRGSEEFFALSSQVRSLLNDAVASAVENEVADHA